MNRRIRIGEVEVTAVSDGTLDESLAMVAGMPREQASSLSGADSEGRVDLPVNCFLLRHSAGLSLIDAGAADRMRFGLGRLPANLAAVGVNPEDIAHVLLTHLHPDHAYGLTRTDGTPVFPNAEIIVHADDAGFWLDRPITADLSDVRRRMMQTNRAVIAPYANRLRRITDGVVFPGIRAELYPGHSPGHCAFFIESGDSRMMAWGDIVHMPALQVPYPDTGIVYDFDAPMATASRKRAFASLAGTHTVIAGAHVDGFTRLVKRGDVFHLVPVGDQHPHT